MDAERKLDGKVAIVTGAGSSGPGVGTGKAMSVLLPSDGARFVLVDKVEERAEEKLELIEDEGGEATIVPLDLADIEAANRSGGCSHSAFGGVDILVNNAAVASSTGILDTTPELYQQFSQ